MCGDFCGSAILLIDGPQAVHQKIFVIIHLIAAIPYDHRRITAGGHNGGLLTRQHLPDAVDNAVQHSRGAVDDAGAHTVLCIFPNQLFQIQD